MPRRQAGHFSLIIYFYQASSFFFLLKNFSTTQRVKGHAGNYGVTHGYTRACARAGCNSQRQAAENECKRSHQNRTETEAGCFNCRINNAHTFFHIHFGIFYNQNCVLGSEADKHNQTNLHINVVLLSAQVLAESRECSPVRQ